MSEPLTVTISEDDLAKIAAALAETKAARARADRAFIAFRHHLATLEEIIYEIKPAVPR